MHLVGLKSWGLLSAWDRQGVRISEQLCTQWFCLQLVFQCSSFPVCCFVLGSSRRIIRRATALLISQLYTIIVVHSSMTVSEMLSFCIWWHFSWLDLFRTNKAHCDFQYLSMMSSMHMIIYYNICIIIYIWYVYWYTIYTQYSTIGYTILHYNML